MREAGGLDGDKMVPPNLRRTSISRKKALVAALTHIIPCFRAFVGEKVKESLSVNDVSMGVKNAADTFGKVCIHPQKCDFGHFIVYDF